MIERFDWCESGMEVSHSGDYVAYEEYENLENDYETLQRDMTTLKDKIYELYRDY